MPDFAISCLAVDIFGGPAGLWYGQFEGLEWPGIPNGIRWQSGVMKPLSSLENARSSIAANTAWRAYRLLNGFLSTANQKYQLELSGIAWYRSDALVLTWPTTDAGSVSPGSKTSAWLLSTDSAFASTLELTL